MGEYSSLQTAELMLAYCEEFDLGRGNSRDWDYKHFKLIEGALMPEEYVLTIFEGLHNYRSITNHDNNFAYAITNKRIIMAQKRMIGSVVQSINIDNVNDITIGNGLLLGTITVDTTKECFNVCVSKNRAQKIHSLIHQTLERLKSSKIESTQQKNSSGTNDSISNQLVELKNLLDMGVITQDDFDAKKKQLLGL